MQITTVKVSSIKANPHRNLVGNPLVTEKVDALAVSIQQTGFWQPLVVRESGGDTQLLFGHHRLGALKKLKIKYVHVIYQDTSDEDMIRVQSSENSQEWENTADNDIETIRAVLEAFDHEKIVLAVCVYQTT